MIGGLSVLLLFFSKVEITLWVNAHNSPAADYFFRYFTYLGDGVVAAVISLIFMFFNVRKGILLLITFILSGLLIQYLKIHIFPDVLRPVALIGHTYPLHLVDGVKIGDIQSFPSGHTGTAFGIFYCFAAFTKSRRIQVASFLIAVLLGYSRMYLSQHFLPDVIGGAVLGTFISICLLIMFEETNFLKRFDRPMFSGRW